jgi:hypothetical protein
MELFWALPYLVGSIVLHAFTTRLQWGNPITKFLAVGGAGGVALMCHMSWLCGASLATLAALSVYAFVCELYLFVFTLVAGSVSARLLQLLWERDLTMAQIQGLYDTTSMVTRRVDHLVAAGLLEPDGSGYRVTAKGRRVVTVFLSVKGFFRHDQEPPQRRAA